MPAGSVRRCHGLMSAHAERAVAGWDGRHRARLTPDRQREMQCALHTEGTSEGGAKRKAPPRNGPDRSELRPRQQQHEPPRHRPLGNGVMPQSGEHTAGQGEHPRPATGHGTARPRPTLTAAGGRPVLALNDRLSSHHDTPVGCRRTSGGYGNVVGRVQRTRDSADPCAAPLTGSGAARTGCAPRSADWHSAWSCWCCRRCTAPATRCWRRPPRAGTRSDSWCCCS